MSDIRPSDLQAIRRDSVPTQIARQIRHRILTNEFAPGQQLPPESELAEMMGVGRSSVREAIVALVLMGLLQRTRVGTFVAPDEHLFSALLQSERRFAPRALSIENVFEVRQIVEPRIAATAAERATPEDLDRIREAIDLLDTAPDRTSIIRADLRFHTSIAEATHNPLMLDIYADIIESLALLHKSYEHIYHDLNTLLWSKHNHAALFTALTHGDSAGAFNLVDEMLVVSLRSIQGIAN